MSDSISGGLKSSPVWGWNWEAINAMAYNEDGMPKRDEQGNHERRYKYIINEGSSRSSKTYSLIDCYDVYARMHKHKRLTVWRDTKKSCKDTVLNDALKHFKLTGRYDPRAFNITDSVFRYPNSSTFEIHGTDDETTVHGLTQDAAWLNEPYKISRAIFDQIDQRTSDFIFIDWNPRKAHWIEDLKKDKRAIVIKSRFIHNPFCPPEQKLKILSYQPVSMCRIVLKKILSEKEAKEYDLATNPLQFTVSALEELERCRENEHKRSASSYNWSVYGLGEKAEKPNRIFRWEEIPLDEYLALEVPTYHYSDWGAVDPWAVGEAKYLDGCLYLREKNYESENEIRERLTSTERIQIGTDDEGIVTWSFNRFNVKTDEVIVCDPNRPAKILALRAAGYDYAVAARKGPGSIIDGIDTLSNLRVYYTSDSPNIKYEQENYSRQIDKYGVVQEEPEDFDNHHMDGARYIASYLEAEGVIRKI